MVKKTLWFVFCCLVSGGATAEPGNTSNDSFNKAKKLLLEKVFVGQGYNRTLYCDAEFHGKSITLPQGFETKSYKKRLSLEFEHALPAENFGRAFKEWRDGDEACIDSKGKPFKGRKCAEKVNKQYRLMAADMFNLFGSIGAVNATRQNYQFTMLPSAKSAFGSCDFRVEGKKVQPPEGSRGRIARAHLYFEQVYSPIFKLSPAQRKLMNAWDKQYPVTAEECEINRRIKAIQESSNPILDSRC